MPEWKEELGERLAGLDFEPSRASELVEELSQHLADRRAELIAQGTTPEDADRQVLSELRAQDLLINLSRLRLASQAPPPVLGAPRRRVLADLAQDLGYALRTLRRTPGYTAAAILTLALGVGANSAIFTLVNATLLQELPVPEPDRLYFLRAEESVVLSYPEYVDLRDHQTPFEGLAAWGGTSISLSATQGTDLVSGAIVTSNYFDVLGVRAALGRLLGPQDGRTPGAHPVVVLSHGLWQRRFGGRLDVVGQELLLNGHPFTVVGVTPPEFSSAELAIRRDVFVPMMMQAVIRPPRAGYSGEMDPDLLGRRGARWLFLVGRLATGWTSEQAREALVPLGESLATTAGHEEDYRFALMPAGTGNPGRRAQVIPVAALLSAVVGLVLLIACANVANLTLSRAAARTREIAVRLAIGASGGRLVRQLLTEGLVVALAGGGLGLVLCVLTVDSLRAALPSGGLPMVEARIDLRVLLFTLAVAVSAGALFSLAPALRAARVPLVPALKEGEAARGGRRRILDLRSGLAVAQVALSLLLLLAAGLFLRSLHQTQSVPTGFDAERLVAAPLRVELLRYSREQGARFYRRVIEATEALPGVERAGLARVAILTGRGRVSSLSVEGRGGADDAFNVEGGGLNAAGLDSVNVNVVDSGYFSTLGIALRGGRVFGLEDAAEAPRVAVVNEAFVRLHYPGGGVGSALRQRISLAGPDGPWAEVVGVVSDTRYRALVEPPAPIAYLPLSQNHESGVILYVRTTGDPGALVPAVRRAVQSLEPNLPLPLLQPVTETVARSIMAPRMGALLLGGFAVLALVLSTIGVYGVMAFAVSRRTREIGVRMALGSERNAVLWLVMRDGMRLVGAGTLLGLIAALAGARTLERFLYGIGGLDSLTFAVVPILLAAVAGLACLVAARRAAWVDPLVALRTE